MLFLKQIAPTLKLCYKNLHWIAAGIGLDVVFLIFVNLVFLRAYSTIILNIDEIQRILTENFANFDANQELAVMQLSQNQAMLFVYYKEILIWVGIFIAAVYILWVLTQSLTWIIAHRINGSKTKFWRYFGYFALSSLAGLLLILGAVFVSTNILNYLTQLKIAIAATNLKLVAYLPLIVTFIASYFIIALYSVIPFKRPLAGFAAVAIKNAAKTIPVFFAGIIFLLLIHLIIIILIKISLVAALAGIILILLPGIGIARCYFCGAVKEISGAAD